MQLLKFPAQIKFLVGTGGSHDDLALGATVTVPNLEQRLRRHLKPTNKSWRVDETYMRLKGAWCYLYRAIDSTGATIDFLLSALRDSTAAKRLFRKALSGPIPSAAPHHQH